MCTLLRGQTSFEVSFIRYSTLGTQSFLFSFPHFLREGSKTMSSKVMHMVGKIFDGIVIGIYELNHQIKYPTY